MTRRGSHFGVPIRNPLGTKVTAVVRQGPFSGHLQFFMNSEVPGAS